jgi:hypothetical protein
MSSTGFDMRIVFSKQLKAKKLVFTKFFLNLLKKFKKQFSFVIQMLNPLC